LTMLVVAFVGDPLLRHNHIKDIASILLAVLVVLSAIVYQTGRLRMKTLSDPSIQTPVRSKASLEMGGQTTEGQAVLLDHEESDNSTTAIGSESVTPPLLSARPPQEQTSAPKWWQPLCAVLVRYSVMLLFVIADSTRSLVNAAALSSASIVPQSMVMMSSLVSILIATTMSGCLNGCQGLKYAWNLPRILHSFGVAILFSLASTALTSAYALGISASVATVLGYIYMPICAIASYWVFNRCYMWLEWLALTMVACSAVAFVDLRQVYETTKTSSTDEESTSTLAVVLVLASACISVAASLLFEKIMKGERLPFYIQKNHLEIGGVITALIMFFPISFISGRDTDAFWKERPVAPFGGSCESTCWVEPGLCSNAGCSCSCGSGMLVGWLSLPVLGALAANMTQSWLGGLLAKRFSSVDKAVAQCLSLLVTYFVGDLWINQKSGGGDISMTLVAFVVPVTVFLFQSAAQEMAIEADKEVKVANAIVEKRNSSLLEHGDHNDVPGIAEELALESSRGAEDGENS